MGSTPLTFTGPAIPILDAQPTPEQQQASALQSSVSYGAKQNPDEYAKLLELQKKTGVGPQLATGNVPQVQHAADVNSIDYPQFAVSHPRTTAWASQPDNAAVAGVDEIHRTSRIEQHAATMRAMTPDEAFDAKYSAPFYRKLMNWTPSADLPDLKPARWLLEGTGAIAGMVGNIGAAVGITGNNATGLNKLQIAGRMLGPEAWTTQKSQADVVVKNIAPMVPAVLASGGVSLLARTLGLSTTAAKVLAGLSVGGMFDASQAGETYSSVKGSGASDYDARIAANRVAAINAPANAMFGVTDLIPFMRNNPLLTALGVGGVIGASGQIGQNAVAGKPWVQGIGGAAIEGAAMQGGMHLGTGFLGHLAAVVNEAETSKLRERSPEAFKTSLEHNFAGDQSLRIPSEQFSEYFKGKGMDPAAVARDLGSSNYAESVVSGGDVEIPPADFISKLDPEHQKALLADIVDPSTGLTARQHEEGRAELEQFATGGGAEKLQADTAAADAETASTPEYLDVKEQIRQRYVDAGETPEVAETLATKDANAYANLARNAGMKPSELLNLYNPKVVAGEAPGTDSMAGVTLHQGAGDNSTQPNEGTPAVHEETGLPLNEDGTVTLYHATTKAGADAIRRTGKLKSAGEPDVYLSTANAGTGYGDGTTIAVRVDPNKLQIDDEFPDGRKDYRIDTGRPGGSVPIKLDSPPAPAKGAGVLHQGEGDQPRGWFRVLPDGSYEIGKTEIGDLSTFVHEPGHAYLKIIGDLAKREGASDTLKDDYGKILDFLGAKDGEALTREQQETWARANEAYLREGKAPSPRLKGVFQRFAIWLGTVYKKATDLGVTLSDDIRGVFDRLYAAEEGVNKAEAEAGPKLFTSAEEAGYTDAEFKAHAELNNMSVEQAKSDILGRLNEAALRDKTDAWREEEKNVREAVTAEVDSRPEYKAIRQLRKGELADGSPLTLNRDALIKQFGEARVKELQKQHPGLYRNEGGIDTEAAAEILGFESAGKMMSVLESTPRRSAAIETATRDYMTAKHGDIRYDGSLDDQARLALENDKKAEATHRELTALKKRLAAMKAEKTGQKEALRNISVAPIASYREAAHHMVESKAIADLQPTRYLDASRKYSREAFDALRKGDVQEAAEAKHKELMNHFLFREATNAKEFVAKAEAFAAKVITPKRQSDIGKAGQDFLSQVQGVLQKYRFVDAFRNPAVSDGESLSDFLGRMRDEGQSMPIAPSVIDGAGKPYKMLTVGELRDVHAALKMLDHVARNITKVTIEGRKIEEAVVAAGLDKSLVDNVKGGERNSGDRVSDDARTFMQRMKDSAGKLDISVLRPEFLFKRLDGLKDVGPWHDAFWNKYNDAQNHLTNLREGLYPGLLDITRGDWSKGLDERIYIKSIDATLSKNDIFSILLNSGNDSNMEKLERGGLRFKVDGTALPVTEDVRQELFSHLSAEDIGKANQILKMIGTLKPEAEKLALKRNGVAPQWIEPRPYETPNGTLEGGYFPLAYDPRWSSAGEKQADANTVDQMFSRYASASTRQGYTKERTAFAAPLSLDWQSVVMRHLDNVMIDISHWEFVTEAQRLLKNPAVKESVISNMGEAYHKNLADWIKFTVNQDNMGREATDGIDKFRRTVRGNVGTAVLGFRVMNAVVETGITPLLALQQAHPVSVYKGLMTYMRNPMEATRFAASASDYMKNIDVQYDRQITEMWNDLRGDHSIMGDIKKWAIMSRVGIWKIGSVMAWHAGFQDAQRQGLDGTAAVRVADSLNRKIQEAGRPGDLSAVERNPYMRELTMFAGPTIIQFNNYMEAAHAIGDKGFNAQTAGKAMTVLMAGHLVQSVLFELLRGKGPSDEDKWPAWLMARMSLGLFDGVPVLNQATRYGETKITGEGGGEPRLVPVLQLGKDSVDAISRTLEAAKGDGDWSRAINTDARAVGGWTGLPMTQGTITGQYIYDRMTGEYLPEHPWSHVTDIFYARHKH